MGRVSFPPTRRDYEVRLVVSALQKCIRRSDADGALYWAFELEKSGFGNWAWKRIRVICSEDVGPTVPGMAADIRALYENWKQADKKDESKVLFIAHAVIALCNAPKSRVVDWACWHHGNDHVERKEIPDEAKDRHTMDGRRLGRGWQHFFEEGSILIQPEGTPEQRIAELEAEYREEASKRIEFLETGSAEAKAKLVDNPWTGQVEVKNVNMETGEVIDGPPAVHRLPGMDD
ncbi:MgsA AAA+ ATPase C-terminal [uncultured Caudovirales phage]|uniref:MgsA AAA+ ATPase C-terminal n=1 Tax=uncultured Caudovirales phage TaxID=2100421 RepID=A0A6J5RQM6_9CAUD|nr:MgsA AAA+ ATPase C-terminal [uncultured Caudovirales phage]